MTSGMQDRVAAAFGLGHPTGDLHPIQAASNETWRLDCGSGAFLVKRLGPGATTYRLHELETAMELERRALEAGVSAAVPVPPVEPLFGWVTVLPDGAWRAYEWLDHTSTDPVGPDSLWFGTTLATLHRLYPLPGTAQPPWRWLGVHAASDWERWIAEAGRRQRPWAPVADGEVEAVLHVTADVRRIYGQASDAVVGHGDFGPWNVLQTAGGPVLIDWDSAGPTTATTELGRAVVAFGDDDLARMRGLVTAYTDAGGVVSGASTDLFAWLITQQLSGLAERVKIDLGELDEDDDPEPLWMDPATITADIVHALTTLSARWQELRRRSEHVLHLADPGEGSPCGGFPSTADR